MTDREIVEMYHAGDKNAVVCLLKKYRGLSLRYWKAYVKDKGMTSFDDFMQDLYFPFEYILGWYDVDRIPKNGEITYRIQGKLWQVTHPKKPVIVGEPLEKGAIQDISEIITGDYREKEGNILKHMEANIRKTVKKKNLFVVLQTLYGTTYQEMVDILKKEGISITKQALSLRWKQEEEVVREFYEDSLAIYC